jgi:protein-arginine deiminase
VKTTLLGSALVAVCFVASCSDNNNSPPQPDSGAAVVDIIADNNRNGTLDWNDPTEEANKTTWDATHGAIFMANIDDSASACPSTDASGAILGDIQLAACNDAQDTVVNGQNDVADLAQLGVRAWPSAPAGTLGTVSVDAASAPLVHLFIQRGAGLPVFFDWQNGDQIQTAELQAGNVLLFIEATDVVRDPTVWNGYTTVTLSVNVGSGTQTDSVMLRVAPVVTRHQLAPEEQMYVTAYSDDEGSVAMRSSLYSDMAGSGEGDGGAAGSPPSNMYEINGEETYGTGTPFDDQWTQDYFEVGYASMPMAGNQQHIMSIYIRSANIYSTNPQDPLRPAGKVVFAKFRGPGSAGLQQFDMSSDPDMDSLNSFGNLETIPPYSLNGTNYPLGRLFRGNVPSWHPDLSFEKMMEAQLVQPPVYIDTSWLYVGHVDETTSFVTVSSPRGWALLLNDPALAVQMLQDQVTAGNGDVLMFAGENWLDDNNNPTPAQISINDVLADMDVMTTSNSAVASVNAELQVIQQATGLTDAEIIHIPYLYQPEQTGSLAYQPGTVNGLYYAADTFAAPDPHGPIINGVDIFKAQMETALQGIGLKVAWVEDWDLYHRLAGEVHCGTNSKRGLVPGEQWWTSGY